MAFTDITGYSFFTEARWGSNGASNGTPEYVVGRSGSQIVSGRKTWVGGLPGGAVETNWVNVNLTASANGANGVGWYVQGGTPEPLTYTGVQYASIIEVRFRAGVIGPGKQAYWRNVSMSLFESEDADRPLAEYTLDQLLADTWDETEAGETEAIEPYSFSGVGYVPKVTFQGQVRFASKSGNLSWNDVFAQVFFFAEGGGG